MATAHFPQGCLTVCFPFHFNSMGCFCCFHVISPACEPRALINRPLKRYRTSIIDAADCCHLEVSLRKLITRVTRLPAAATTAATTAALCFLLVLRHAGLHSPGGVIHYFLTLAVAGVRVGGVLGPLHRRRCKKWGRLHSNAPSHPRPTCCSEPLSRCERFDRGRGEKAEQQSHQVNEYWSQGRSF